MKISPLPLSSTFPGRLHWQPACTLGFPFITETSDQWSVIGSGIGTGSNALKTAIGEYFERKHFYTDIMTDIKSTLNHSLTEREINHFTMAFTQTSRPSLPTEELTKHTYNLTKVVRTSDFSKCYIPTACISLNHYLLGKDNSIYPSKDTCGCSFHWQAENAMFGSIKECLERQFLTRFWLTGQHVERLSSKDIADLLKHSNTRHLAKALTKAGRVVALDICDPAFPGNCIIVFYGQSHRNHQIKYCTGMAYAKNKSLGLEKALEELWQTFRFMDLFASCSGDTRTLKDPYLRHFFNCNTYTCYTEITTTTAMTPCPKKTPYPFSLDGLLQALSNQNINGYFYTKFSHIENNACVFSKFVSPQLFMHMDNSTCINMHNDYSARFEKDVIPKRKKVMVPFP